MPIFWLRSFRSYWLRLGVFIVVGVVYVVSGVEIGGGWIFGVGGGVGIGVIFRIFLYCLNVSSGR